MSRKKIIIIIFSSAVLLSAALVIGAFILFRNKESNSLQELLQAADNFIARAYLTEAERLVAQVFEKAGSAETMLKVLKRAFRIAGMKKNYSAYKDYALRAFEKIPGSAELCRVALSASLADGDPGRALSLGHGFHNLPQVQSLLAEAYLRVNQTPTDQVLNTIPLYRDYFVLEKKESPKRFMAAGQELGDDRFFLDAALLYMQEGNIKQASEIADRYLLDTDFDLVSGLIAYDSGAFERALSRLAAAASANDERADLPIIVGDLFVMSDKHDRAASLYEQAIKRDPAYSQVPYINLSWVMQNEGLHEKALFLLRKAYGLFPDAAGTTIEYAKLLFRRGEKKEADLVLEAYLKKHPDDFDVRLLKLNFSWKEITLERRILALKDFFYENPRNELAGEILVSTLLRNKDISGARAVITHVSEVRGTSASAWIQNALGVFRAFEGDLEDSLVCFTQALRLAERWDLRYNRAVVFMELGKPKDAEADLKQARMQIETGTESQENRARIHALLAEVYLKRGMANEAENQVAEALKLDPKSAQAYLIRKKLQEAKKD